MVFTPRRLPRIATAAAACLVSGITPCSPAHGFTALNGAAAAPRTRARPAAYDVGKNAAGGRRGTPANPLAVLAVSSDVVDAATARSPSGDVVVLSYDGTVADTAETNALLAIDVVLSLWPELIQLYIGIDDGSINEAGSETPDEGPESPGDDEESEAESRGCCNAGGGGGGGGDWLLNKVMALAPAMGSDPDALMGCDAVLLARMLLEEQRLDSGRSAGCTGKYGSKFHPSSSGAADHDGGDDDADADAGRDWRGNANGSRPLTVGEVRANWSTGALLRETARVRYNIDGRDPMPFIREEIELLRREESSIYPTPPLNQAVVDVLSSGAGAGGDDDGGKTVVICVGHSCHIPAALESLSKVNNSIRVAEQMEDDEDTMLLNGGGIVIVPPRHDRESHREIVQHITERVAASAAASTTLDDGDTEAVAVAIEERRAPKSVYLVHSSSGVLNDCKRHLLGDDRPRLMDGILRTPVANGRVQLSLLLPTWADNVDKQHENDAEMDPWLGVLNEKDVQKFLVGSEADARLIEAAPFS